MEALTDILIGIDHQVLKGDTGLEVANLVFDSRKVQENDAFVAVKGTNLDGHKFIQQAIEKGARAIILEEEPQELADQVGYVQVHDSANALGIMAHNFYHQPSHQLRLVGVTGTNGKTTTTYLLYNLFTNLEYKAGLISTINTKYNGKQIDGALTTPDPVTINATLSDMVNHNVSHVFMEVSSHALDQERVAGLNFTGGIFTNISHEHLDYHNTFNEYLQAKQKLFNNLDEEAFALTNLDDKRAMVMVQNTKARKRTYSLKKLSDYKGKILENDVNGMRLLIDEEELYAPLSGRFNAYNLVAAYACGIELGLTKAQVLQSLSMAKGAEGRFEIVQNSSGIVGILDYAHSPDALENVLLNIKEVNQHQGRIFTVIGCGGNRDREKRPVMAKTAIQHSDQVIFTSDNPRDEDPDEIINEMEEGVAADKKNKSLSITKRDQAIKTTCQMAGSGDIILVAGKGHEKYQEINGKRYDFDDRALLNQYLNAVAG